MKNRETEAVDMKDSTVPCLLTRVFTGFSVSYCLSHGHKMLNKEISRGDSSETVKPVNRQFMGQGGNK